MTKLTKKAIRYGRTYRRTDPNYRKASLLKSESGQCLILPFFSLEHILLPLFIYVIQYNPFRKRQMNVEFEQFYWFSPPPPFPLLNLETINNF